MSASIARAIAFEILLRVDAEGAYASDLLHARVGTSVKPADAALATELTLGVLRWRGLLDFQLERQLKKPVAKLDLPVALALRMGLYQLRFLQRIPPSAAVNESVELVKRARKSSAASLVNAVLRRAAEDKADLASQALNDFPPANRLAVLHSHPAWMIERWLARFGEPLTLALLDADNRAPRLSCALHEPGRRDEILARLMQSGLRIEAGALLQNAFAVTGGSVANTDAFRSGAISIQDEASQIIPLLLDVRPGDRVLDLCAAPGGKTASLVRAAGSTGVVIAADRHEHRLRAMRTQLERLKIASLPSAALTSAKASALLVELDARQSLPFRFQFDSILADAPCSGTGTLARHPEIRWRLKPELLAEFHRLQVAILTSAIDALAPGGRLLYSTCSLESEENESVIAEVLELSLRKSLRLVSTSALANKLGPHIQKGVDPSSLFDSSGYFRTFPGTHRTDGFFAVAIEKSE